MDCLAHSAIKMALLYLPTLCHTEGNKTLEINTRYIVLLLKLLIIIITVLILLFKFNFFLFLKLKKCVVKCLSNN